MRQPNGLWEGRARAEQTVPEHGTEGVDPIRDDTSLLALCQQFRRDWNLYHRTW